jgi:hypothetical protein
MATHPDLTADELETLSRDAATQMSPLLGVAVLRLISEVRRRRERPLACESCGGDETYTLCRFCDNDD